MDEPYVIGVRLALEDGVSAGIARIAETMKATQAMLAGVAALPRPGPAAALIGQASQGAKQLPPAPAAEPPPAPQGATERVIETTQSHTREIATAEPQAAQAAQATATEPPGPQPISRVIERIVHPATPAPDAPWSPSPERPDMADPVVLPVLAARHAEAAPLGARPQAAPIEPAAQQALAPQLAAAMPAMAPSAEPAPSSGGEGGAVYLDGALVGRWLSDRLAREASRPGGGATGFDPRMGPSWPGALQGA